MSIKSQTCEMFIMQFNNTRHHDFQNVERLIYISMYVLSTMGVSKELISKFLIGNRFHVKSRILSPYSNRTEDQSLFYLNKD